MVMLHIYPAVVCLVQPVRPVRRVQPRLVLAAANQHTMAMPVLARHVNHVLRMLYVMAETVQHLSVPVVILVIGIPANHMSDVLPVRRMRRVIQMDIPVTRGIMPVPNRGQITNIRARVVRAKCFMTRLHRWILTCIQEWIMAHLPRQLRMTKRIVISPRIIIIHTKILRVNFVGLRIVIIPNKINGHTIKKHPKRGAFFFSGGLGRNRTGIQGFAVLCITTLPPGLNFVCQYYAKKNCNSTEKLYNLKYYRTEREFL